MDYKKTDALVDDDPQHDDDDGEGEGEGEMEGEGENGEDVDEEEEKPPTKQDLEKPETKVNKCETIVDCSPREQIDQRVGSLTPKPYFNLLRKNCHLMSLKNAPR